MGIFGDYDVRFDPWDVEYGPEFPLDVSDDPNDDEVNLDVEQPADCWRPVAPANPAAFDALHFIDGVRRIEARVLVRKSEQICHGAFGSVAIGSAVIRSGCARIETAEIKRIAPLDSGAIFPDRIAVAPALVYDPASWPKAEVDGPLREVQRRMRDVEAELARRIAINENVLVIADGPLSYEHSVKGSVLGYIKRIFKLYLPMRHLSVVSALVVGQRTPLFVLRTMKRGRYSWFQRIGVTHPGDSELSGIVRMEVSSHVGVPAARRLADTAASMLPRFAPTRGRDPRAPQNLLPIGALESHLRRRLGDARLTRRWIQSLIAREAPRV